MARGGSRARSGPVPDLDAFARDRDAGNWVRLPSKWEFDPPEWPLDSAFGIRVGRGEDAYTEDYHERELEHWAKLWSQGQAAMWLLNKQETAVALYCRALTFTEATMGAGSPSQMLAELRRQQEDLGLSTAGLLRNKWRFAAQDDLSEKAARDKEDAGEKRKAKATRDAENGKVVDMFSGLKTRGAS